MHERLTDSMFLDHQTRVEVSISRLPGLDEHQQPYQESLAGNVLPRLCAAFGERACKDMCQAPEDFDNTDKRCAAQNGQEVFDSLGIPREQVYMAAVCGSATVAFLDGTVRSSMREPEQGYKTFAKTDGLFGPVEYAKGCRLADCGLLVVSGKDESGQGFNGFIHASRLNMNGNDQFRDANNQPVGGVTKMLQEAQQHYKPQEIRVQLAAGISPDLYVFDFTPSAKDLEANSNDTTELKRERLFKDWHDAGWIVPYMEAGVWDGASYSVDMYAAVKDQVIRAGLGNVYSDDAMIADGSLATGHASNRAGKNGRVAEARDLYIVASHASPHSIWKINSQRS